VGFKGGKDIREGRRAPKRGAGGYHGRIVRSGRVFAAGAFALVLAARAVPDEPELGVPLFPGSEPRARATQRLEMLRNVRWKAAAAFHAEARLSEVLEHFRRQKERLEGEAGTGLEPKGRLKEWLEKEPGELARYREFRRAQAGGAVSLMEWQVLSQKASEIPLSLGGGDGMRAKRLEGAQVEVAFGRIALADSTVSVQLISPHPSEEGRELEPGTLIALIRESRESAAPFAPPGDETVDGPEDSGLASRLSGYVLMDQPVGGMRALSLPRHEEWMVRAAGGGPGVVHSLSGPDEDGRIAYVENHAAAGRHYLKSVRVDGGQDEKIFERPGEAFFERAIGGSLALSPRGGRVALIGRLARFQTNRPAFPLRIGPLEVWDLERKSGREVGVQALDRRVSWFPNARRLVYVELVPAAKAPPARRAEEDRFGEGFRGWEAVPVTRILDVETGARRDLHPGWDPVVSADGSGVLVRDGENHWRLVDPRDGGSRPVTWPGDAGGAIALEGELVLYWGLPTRGTPPEFTRVYSLSVGPRPMKTLKVTQLDSPRFQTLLASVDPRREITFGRATKPR
jgi:hypothetical protein